MRHILLLMLLSLLIGCGTTPATAPETARPAPIALSNTPAVTRQLYAQHEEWQGTRYRMGGLSKQGVDCSGFVYTTFLQRLGLEIPRSTELQASLGREIRRSDLRAGDLVFFKTGSKDRHVGIYVEQGKFLHASTSKGVIISQLDNVYWNSSFWKAVRI